MTYRLKINSYATEDVEAKSAIYALAEYVDTRIPPVQQVLIRAQGDEATLTSRDYTIEARPLEYDVWLKDWNDLMSNPLALATALRDALEAIR